MAEIRCPHCEEMVEVDPTEIDEDELTCPECGEGFPLSDEDREQLELSGEYGDLTALDFVTDRDLEGDYSSELDRSY